MMQDRLLNISLKFLSLSDRMFLRTYVFECIDAIEQMPDKLESPDPIMEGVGKFLMIHYNYKDLEKIQRICYGYTNDCVNRLLKEQRDDFESSHSSF